MYVTNTEDSSLSEKQKPYHTSHNSNDQGLGSQTPTTTAIFLAPFENNFLDKNAEMAAARASYLRVFVGGTFMTIVMIFAIFSIFWGSLWKTPMYNLPGWIIDFDEGLVGQTVSQALQQTSSTSKITWAVVSAYDFPGGQTELANAVVEEKIWVAVSINAGASVRLNASISAPDNKYDGSQAITVYAVEARNENAFRSMIRPSVQASLDGISKAFAVRLAQQSAAIPNLVNILSTSPQTIVAPISYQIKNLVPFDIPVATAVSFVGLIYQLILSFFIVMTGNAARTKSGLQDHLNTKSLITIRLVSSFAAYLAVSLFYSLLSVAFQLDLTRKFGHSGFLVFWMLNWLGMLALGLAIESMLTLMTSSFVPFFMLGWIIINVSVCIFPIEALPKVFHYGYAAPFYNVSRAMRTIVFGTKNRVGFSFGILIIWVAISCISLPIFQWLVRNRMTKSKKSETTVNVRKA